METITHAELIIKAKKLLKNTFHCRSILTELVAYTRSRETPDVIGWVRNWSILVECKTSRADFKADQHKLSRIYITGLGHWKLYLTTKGLLDGLKIPEGWGLYEVCGKTIRYNRGIKYCNTAQPPNKSCRDSEVALLISAVERNITSASSGPGSPASDAYRDMEKYKKNNKRRSNKCKDNLFHHSVAGRMADGDGNVLLW